MEDFAEVQQQIAEKLKHGFDTRHIYQMFSTFVDKIQHQAEEIQEMKENAEKSELIIESMNTTIRTMEMNIQGFVTLPPVDDDETLKASRRPSVSSRRPSGASRRPSEHNVQPTVQDSQHDDNTAVATKKDVAAPISKPASLANSPRVGPDEWEKEVAVEKTPSEDTNEVRPYPIPESKPPRRDSLAGQKKNKKKARRGSDPAWKFKKRRIIRQVSMKLKEEKEEEVAAENEDDEPKHIENTSSTEKQNVEDSSSSQYDKAACVVPTEKIESDKQQEMSIDSVQSVVESQQCPLQEFTPAEMEQNVEVSHVLEKPPISARGNVEQISTIHSSKPPSGAHSKRTSPDFQLKMDEKQSVGPRSRRPSGYSPIVTHRSVAAEDIPQIDPTQTVVYRISSLEATVEDMAKVIEMQRKAIDEQRLALEAAKSALKSRRNSSSKNEEQVPSSFDFLNCDAFTENASVASATMKDVEDDTEDNDIDFREEENDGNQQDDVQTKTRVVEISPPVPEQNKGGTGGSEKFDFSNVVKFNDQQLLPPESAGIISKQVCSSDVMKKLLDRVVKSSEIMMDQSLKRLPKPPPQITANDMLTDSIVATIAQSMLKRGLLDELKTVNDDIESPRIVQSKSRSSSILQTPTPVMSVGPTVSSADFKEVRDAIVSRNEIMDMIKDHVKEITPQTHASESPPQPQSFEFTPYVSEPIPLTKPAVEREVTIQPKKYQEMDDDVTIEDHSPQRISSPRASIREQDSSVREATMGERARTVLEQHVDCIEHDKVSTAQLENLTRNMSKHITMEVNKVSAHYENMLAKLSSNIQDRQEQNEKGIVNLRHALNDLEASVSNQLQHTHKSTKKKDDESWKTDLLKVSQSVNKAREDQRTVAKMLVEELENLQNQMKDRVDETRLEILAQSIEENVQKELGQRVSGINNSMAKIISAVRNKTDRAETEALITNRLHEAEEALRELQDEEPAGAFKCISCGTAGKKMTPNASLESLSFASAIMSQSAEVKRNRGGDLDQTAAVLNRQAGLRPVSRQQKPMTPKEFKPTSAPSKEMTLEPLYRRAKRASHVREIPKIPNITFGVGNQNQYRMDDRPHSPPYFPNLGGTQSAPTTKNGPL